MKKKTKKKPLLIRYEVRFGGWLIFRKGVFIFGCPSKKWALREAIVCAKLEKRKGNRGATVRTKDRNGRYSDEKTFPRSEDPRRSRG